MNEGFTTILYPVRDISQAKKLYNNLLGVQPIMDEAYYVGYKIGNQDIGLVTNGFEQGMTVLRPTIMSLTSSKMHPA